MTKESKPSKEHRSEKKVSVIIPAYNEENAIGHIVKTTLSLEPVTEVLVVNDCSTDNTAKEAGRNGATVISHPYNKGNGASIKTGIRNAQNEIVVLMDGDGQHDPNFIPEFLKGMPEYDLIIGSRDASSEANILRRFGNWALKRLSSYLIGFKIKDLTSGFRMAKKSKMLEFIHLFPNGYSYPTTSTMAMLKAGYNVGFTPIKANKRIGKSKLKPFRNGIKFIMIILRIVTLFNPLRIFLPASLLLVIPGTIYGLYEIIDHLKLPNSAVLLISAGIIVFMMGLISEQIASLRLERKE